MKARERRLQWRHTSRWAWLWKGDFGPRFCSFLFSDRLTNLQLLVANNSHLPESWFKCGLSIWNAAREQDSINLSGHLLLGTSAVPQTGGINCPSFYSKWYPKSSSLKTFSKNIPKIEGSLPDNCLLDWIHQKTSMDNAVSIGLQEVWQRSIFLSQV